MARQERESGLFLGAVERDVYDDSSPQIILGSTWMESWPNVVWKGTQV